jgi:hypothetical protein
MPKFDWDEFFVIDKETDFWYDKGLYILIPISIGLLAFTIWLALKC